MKTNLAERIGSCAAIVGFASYWIPIVLTIWGHWDSIVLLSLITYCISVILLMNAWLERGKHKAKAMFFLIAESMQLLPYVIVLLIKKLLF